MCVRECVRESLRAGVCMCVRVCVHACGCACVEGKGGEGTGKEMARRNTETMID